MTDKTVQRAMLKNATEEMMKTWAEIDLNRMKQMDCYIGIRAGENVNDLSDVPEEKMKMYNSLYSHPVHSEQRVKHTKWVVLRYLTQVWRNSPIQVQKRSKISTSTYVTWITPKWTKRRTRLLT